MDSLSNLLINRKFNEPPEIEKIKQFISNKFGVSVEVNVNKTKITIFANGAALAGRLRADIVMLQQISESDKEIIIIIR